MHFCPALFFGRHSLFKDGELQWIPEPENHCESYKKESDEEQWLEEDCTDREGWQKKCPLDWVYVYSDMVTRENVTFGNAVELIVCMNSSYPLFLLTDQHRGIKKRRN